MDQITINKINELNTRMSSGNLSKSERREAFLEINRLSGEMAVVAMYTPRTSQGNTYNAVTNTVTTPSGKIYASSGGTPPTVTPVDKTTIATPTTTTPNTYNSITGVYTDAAGNQQSMAVAPAGVSHIGTYKGTSQSTSTATTNIIKAIEKGDVQGYSGQLLTAQEAAKANLLSTVTGTPAPQQYGEYIKAATPAGVEAIKQYSKEQTFDLTPKEQFEAALPPSYSVATYSVPTKPSKIDTTVGNLWGKSAESGIVKSILAPVKWIAESEPGKLTVETTKTIWLGTLKGIEEGKKSEGITRLVAKTVEGAVLGTVGLATTSYGLITTPQETIVGLGKGLKELPKATYTALKTDAPGSIAYGVGMFAIPGFKIGKTSKAAKAAEAIKIESAISKGTITTIKDIGITTRKELATIDLAPAMKMKAAKLFEKEGAVRVIKTELEPYPSLIKYTPKVTGTFIESTKISDNLISGIGAGKVVIGFKGKTATQLVAAKTAGSIDEGIVKTFSQVAIGPKTASGIKSGTVYTFVEKTVPIGQTILKSETTGLGRPLMISKTESITGFIKKEPITKTTELLKGYYIREPSVIISKDMGLVTIKKVEPLSIVPDVNYLAKTAKPYSTTTGTQILIPKVTRIDLDTVAPGLAIGKVQKTFLTIGKDKTSFINQIEYDILKKTKSTKPIGFTVKEAPKVVSAIDNLKIFKTGVVTEEAILKTTSASKSAFAPSATRAAVSEISVSLVKTSPGYKIPTGFLGKSREQTIKVNENSFMGSKTSFNIGTYGMNKQGITIPQTSTQFSYVPSIITFKPNIETKGFITSFETDMSSIKPRTSEIHKPGFITALKPKASELTSPRVIDIQKIKVRTNEIQMPRLKEIQMFKERQVIRQLMKIKQIQQLKTQLALRTRQTQIFNVPLKFKNPWIKMPSIKTAPKLDFKLGTNKKRKGLYITEVRRAGKFTPVGSSGNIGGAFELGKKKVLTTLAASFRVRKAGTETLIKMPTTKEFRVGKKEFFVLIQKKGGREGGLAGGRLSTIGEKKEIQFIKRIKRK